MSCWPPIRCSKQFATLARPYIKSLMPSGSAAAGRHRFSFLALVSGAVQLPARQSMGCSRLRFSKHVPQLHGKQGGLFACRRTS